MSYLHYFFLLAYSGVQHILSCVFVFFSFVLCTLCCQILLDCPFLIAPSVFSDVTNNQMNISTHMASVDIAVFYRKTLHFNGFVLLNLVFCVAFC